MKTKYSSIEEMNNRIVHDLEKDARWEQEQADLADDLLKVIGAVALAGLGFLAGFQMGTMRANAATLTRAHLRTTPYYTAGTLMVEPIAESTAEGQPPEAIEADAEATPPDAVMVEAVGERWESAGKWKLTFYCPCRTCSGEWGHRTSSGATCQEGVTVACAILPPGTVVKIDGYGERVVQDTGAGVSGEHLDVFMESHSECLRHGIQYREVWVKR